MQTGAHIEARNVLHLHDIPYLKMVTLFLPPWGPANGKTFNYIGRTWRARTKGQSHAKSTQGDVRTTLW